MLVTHRALIVLAGPVLLSFALLGCSDEGDAEPDATATPPQAAQETATPETSPPDITTDAPPPTTASSGGSEVEMGVGTYCWATMCVDKIGPITKATLSIATGDEVVVAVPDGAPVLNEVSVEAFPAVNPQEFEGGETAWQPDFSRDGTLAAEWDEESVRIPVPLEAGTYVLVVGMYFERGDVQYGVVLEVQ